MLFFPLLKCGKTSGVLEVRVGGLLWLQSTGMPIGPLILMLLGGKKRERKESQRKNKGRENEGPGCPMFF